MSQGSPRRFRSAETAQQVQSGLAVTGDVGGDRFQA
jgi:hypothetical protein